MGYQNFLNAIALKTISKPVITPDYRLMVGESEDLTPQPITVATKYIPSQAQANLADLGKLSDEEFAEKLENQEIEINDFNGNLVTIGNPLGYGGM